MPEVMVDYRNSAIAIIVCHIGEMPWYFSYFLHSCKFNQSIDFLILTDETSLPKYIPKNVQILQTSLAEINELATQKMGYDINIKNGYKLCDFKPTYGVVFSDLLKNYDFWGFGDIDVFYGNIREFITEDLLANYDLISVRPDWIPGCFVLFKNSEKMNKLFTHSKDYIKVLTSDTHYCFDETNFAHDAFTEGLNYKDINTEIESMMHVIKRLEESSYIKVYYDLFIIEGIPGKLKWIDGKLTYRNKYEVLLYHLIHFKKRYSPKKIPSAIPDIFTISKNAIYHKHN